MNKLDEAIANIAYILDSLVVLRIIYESGSCNECERSKVCKYCPKPGQQVRFNCPFYVGGEQTPEQKFARGTGEDLGNAATDVLMPGC